MVLNNPVVAVSTSAAVVVSAGSFFLDTVVPLWTVFAVVAVMLAVLIITVRYVVKGERVGQGIVIEFEPDRAVQFSQGDPHATIRIRFRVSNFQAFDVELEPLGLNLIIGQPVMTLHLSERHTVAGDGKPVSLFVSGQLDPERCAYIARQATDGMLANPVRLEGTAYFTSPAGKFEVPIGMERNDVPWRLR